MEEQQCTDLFTKVFDSHVGGVLRTCVCGIIHFDTYNIGDYDVGELQELRLSEIDNPSKYQEHDGSIGCLEVSGNPIVIGCSCDTAQRYEDFILAHLNELAAYLNHHAKTLREAAVAIEVDVQEIGVQL